MGIDFTFLGCGSAFYPELGSNSAYFIDKDQGMVLIDCGGDTFKKLHRNDAYLKAPSLTVFITHTHSDHIGGLGTLVMHSWYALHRKTSIIAADNTHARLITDILHANGTPKDSYDVIITWKRRYSGFADPLRTAQYISTSHVSEIPSYAIEFNRPENITYWTGDTNDYQSVVDFLELHRSFIDMMYVDCSLRDNPVHLNLSALNTMIEESDRKMITMMHFDGMEASNAARQHGYHSAIDGMV